MDKIQDLKEAEWAFSIFNKCVPEKYRKSSVAVLVGKYSDRMPSDATVNKIAELHTKWMTIMNTEEFIKNNKDKSFLTYLRNNYNNI